MSFMGITPAPESSFVDDGPSQEQERFTPWNKFEEDVLGENSTDSQI